MEKENKVSLWLGYFEKENDFRDYMKVRYDKDGNYIPSKFQELFAIKKYNLDLSEIDWISDKCTDVELLLAGFSNDFEIIPQFKEMLENRDIVKYNSIVLFYNFGYKNNNCPTAELEYIGCANVNL